MLIVNLLLGMYIDMLQIPFDNFKSNYSYELTYKIREEHEEVTEYECVFLRLEVIDNKLMACFKIHNHQVCFTPQQIIRAIEC